jgi:hypothetical protein
MLLATGFFSPYPMAASRSWATRLPCKKVEKAVSITSDAEERRKDSNFLDGITGFTGF